MFWIVSFIMILFPQVSFSDEFVQGYMKSDGTYVQGYYRSDPDGTVRDNYSYKGNVNPYTGAVGTDYYRNNPTSQYYDGGGSSQPSYQPYQPYQPTYGSQESTVQSPFVTTPEDGQASGGESSDSSSSDN